MSAAVASTISITPITKTSALNPSAALGGILGGILGSVTVAPVLGFCALIAECSFRHKAAISVGNTGFQIGLFIGEMVSVTIGALTGNEVSSCLEYTKTKNKEKN